MDVKEFAIALAQAANEAEVIIILKKHNYWNDDTAWQLYGGKENNFATIGNQKSKAEDALVEKIVNSVDAVLTSECWKEGINPEDSSAPTSIADALERFFSIHNGKLSNISATERTRIAQNISLVATGAKTNPCYSIIDKGEGQSPNRLPDTILSIDKNNKMRTQFVQGKFNMGGTAVLRFCGNDNIQLVISKRNPLINDGREDDSKNYWGVTVVRRENPPEGVRSSIYKYLAPDGEILSFKSDSLNLLPGEYPKAYEKPLEWGTFIKLYNYQMTGLKTNILFDLNYKLALLMPSIALPVRLYERRSGYSGHTLETTLSGLSVRLDEDRKDNLEENFPTASPMTVLGQKMRVLIYAFKRGKSNNYTRDEGIIFTINGQTHGILSKAFFSRQAVKHSYIAESLLVIVDCSDLDGRSREDLFLNSRDRLASGELRSQIERALESLLNDHQGLKELREKRRREDIENKLEDSKPLAEVIESILKKSPTLSRLFVQGLRLPNPFNVIPRNNTDTFKGERFPTKFELTRQITEDHPKECPKNVRFRINYKTDAVNDYFDRDSDPGTFKLLVNGKEVENKQVNLWVGTATLNVALPDWVNIGDRLHFESYITDVGRLEPFYSQFYIKVVEPISRKKGDNNGGGRRRPTGTDEGNNGSDSSHLDLPNVIEVRKDDPNWINKQFRDESALRVLDDGEGGYDFYINMSNIHLLTEQKSNTSVDSELLNARYKYGMVLIGIALLKDREESTSQDNEVVDVYDRIKVLTKAMSPILLPMISNLGDLELDEVESVQEIEI